MAKRHVQTDSVAEFFFLFGYLGRLWHVQYRFEVDENDIYSMTSSCYILVAEFVVTNFSRVRKDGYISK